MRRDDPRTTYAKTSDIKGRTYLEYRRDMKRKAIAELEALPWIENVLKQRYPNQSVRVEKSGGDRFLWFLRRGGVTREPDYIAYIGEEKKKVEFQYAEKESLQFYDFKISKVAFSKNKSRIPRDDVLFLYIDKPSQKYALLEAKWIYNHGKIGEVPAWRTEAYRVPAKKFQPQLIDEPNLPHLIQKIEAKNALLDYQSLLYDQMRAVLKARIDDCVTNQTEFSIAPDVIEGFFEACFILSVMEQCPQQLHLWMEQIFKLIYQIESLRQAFMAAFSLDFLYFCASSEEKIDIQQITRILKYLSEFVNNRFNTVDATYDSGSGETVCRETQYALFVVSIIEDMTQDLLHYHSEALPVGERPAPIRQIFQSLPNPLQTSHYIVQNCM